MMSNLSFISNNVKGIHAILKPIKIFEYLKKITPLQMVSFFFKKHTLQSKMKKYGVTNLKGSYFSLFVPTKPMETPKELVLPTPLVLPLVLWVQKH